MGSNQFWKPFVLCLGDGIIISAALCLLFAKWYGQPWPVVLLGTLLSLAGMVLMIIGGYYAHRYRSRSMQLKEGASLKSYNKTALQKNKMLYEHLNLHDRHLLSQAEADIEAENKIWSNYLQQNDADPNAASTGHPLLTGLVIGLSFLCGSILPVLAYLYFGNIHQAIQYSIVGSLIALPIAGFFKSYINGENVFWGSIRMLLLGGTAIGCCWWVADIFLKS